MVHKIKLHLKIQVAQVWLTEFDEHQSSNSVMVGVVVPISTGGNFIFYFIFPLDINSD